MNDLDADKLEYLRDRYHALVALDYKVADDTNDGSLLSLEEVIDRLNEQEELISRLRKELIKYKSSIFDDILDDVHNYYDNKTYTYEGPMPDVRY